MLKVLITPSLLERSMWFATNCSSGLLLNSSINCTLPSALVNTSLTCHRWNAALARRCRYRRAISERPRVRRSTIRSHTLALITVLPTGSLAHGIVSRRPSPRTSQCSQLAGSGTDVGSGTPGIGSQMCSGRRASPKIVVGWRRPCRSCCRRRRCQSGLTVWLSVSRQRT